MRSSLPRASCSWCMMVYRRRWTWLPPRQMTSHTALESRLHSGQVYSSVQVSHCPTIRAARKSPASP
ncbi:hypothetical protein DPMN_105045 [Dreissena polymorpha]|uniref:Uncharacterized protein n=1 Tax=Dreissena polymorpha TaxID=45954 RepID=A0A9D4HB45_DREPO|nr:hypothetical protein DPMN_105045 [Dreissena polymorpha]